jgi:hypothetical protein
MNMMRDLIWGRPEKSTYHTTMVNKVKSHLKRFCTDAGKEHGFVSGRITDAYGYNKVTKTIYFCEIKVNPNDLLKAITQLHITTSNYTPKSREFIEYNVIPVVAIPKKLAGELAKYKPLDWKSFRLLCRTNKIALWIIEQSNIVQIQGPKPKAPKRKAQKSSTKSKPTKRKTTAKSKVTKVRKISAVSRSKTKPKTIAKVKALKKRKSNAKTKTAKSRTKKAKRS